nr:MAG TPA: hypothetical protein [Caudoviricetes sp.]
MSGSSEFYRLHNDGSKYRVFSIFFTYDFIVLSDGMTMRSYTPVSFIKAIRNLFFDVCDTAHQLSGYAIGSLRNRT